MTGVEALPRRTPRDHCLAPARTDAAPLGGGRYGRMFPQLPPLRVEAPLLAALGRAGGVCDARLGQAEARDVAAGWPVFGQYIAHDITADRSPVTHHDDEELLRNVRSARLDLECLYGDGPTANPYLYRRDDPAKLLLGPGSRDGTGQWDLPRNSEGTALVGDPRQDVHLLISQLQVALVQAHNRLVDRLREDGTGEGEVFEEARRALRWHYQWVVLHDFLPALIGPERTARLLERGAPPAADTVTIPLEFADAAYRYGHCQMRSTYRLRTGGPELSLFPDLLGFRPVPAERIVEWPLLLDVPGHPPATRARPIDGRLAAPLIDLPADITGDLADADHASLAVRDLLRGSGTGLPSGEAIAVELGYEPLTPPQTGLAEQGWTGETPLWFYVLKEAEVREDGERLGDVGARIVGDVLLGIVDGDPTSHRVVDPGWRPTLDGRRPGVFTLADLVLPPTPAA